MRRLEFREFDRLLITLKSVGPGVDMVRFRPLSRGKEKDRSNLL